MLLNAKLWGARAGEIQHDSNVSRLVLEVDYETDKETWPLVVQPWCHQDAMGTLVLSVRDRKGIPGGAVLADGDSLVVGMGEFGSWRQELTSAPLQILWELF